MKRTPTPKSAKQPPVAMTVAGSDSGGGAGIQADLLTFSALGVFGTTAITCLTAQNPEGVSEVHEVPAETVAEQMRQIAGFFPLRAMKTGMLFSARIVDVVVGFLREHRRLKVVVDPVMVATSGARLLREDAITAIEKHLLPLATLITPNLDEAAVFLGRRPENHGELVDASVELVERFGVSVLLKGGHLAGNQLADVLARPRRTPVLFTGRRIQGVDTHGSGCTLSAAIAAGLALGQPLEEAVNSARAYLRRGMRQPLAVSRHRFIAHR